MLIHTGWDRHFGTPAYGTGALPRADGVQALIEAGAVLVGIDSLNIDDTNPAASVLLTAHFSRRECTSLNT